MSAQDYRVNAEVRRLLVSRWIDVSRLQIGTTNGVVYLMGTLESAVEDALERSGQGTDSRDPVERLIRLVSLVEKELRRIRGVRDIVCKFRNLRKKGCAWSVVGAAGRGVTPTAAESSRQVHTTLGAEHSASEEPEDEGKSDAETSRRS